MATNNVDYFEVGTARPDEARRFYGELFGWSFGPPSPTKYRMINESQGGLWDTSEIGGAEYAIFYVHVEDVGETVKKAQSLGAKVLVPVTANPAIEFAHLEDGDGNRFGVWRPIA